MNRNSPAKDMRTNKIVFLLAFLLIILTHPVFATDDHLSAVHKERESFARDFAQTVITILHDPKTAYNNRKDILRRAFSASVDIDWIAKFVIGRSWKNATDNQKEQYTSLYKKFLTETYVSSFAENPANSIFNIKILSVADEEKEAFTVHTRMMMMNQNNIKVDYRVSDKDNSYKVVDIIIENVSLINSHRAEFGALATANGIDSVIQKLEQLLAHGKQEVAISMK